MNNPLIFSFSSDISGIPIPTDLNNPFSSQVAEIARIASSEFQQFIEEESSKWPYDFNERDGKMFGILVVRKHDGSYGYLGTVSGNLAHNMVPERLISSVFDESTDDFFINKGMSKLSEICNRIDEETNPSEIAILKEKRKIHSRNLQRRLFENYRFLNFSGKEKNVLQIYAHATSANPPAATGECAAPKLLQYAISHELEPIAIAEFWWGRPIRNANRKHKSFYPACENRCRYILEYMLEDSELYAKRDLSHFL